jgi:hypothetical protein
LESEIQRLEHEVKISFDDMNDYSYTLHAILVHDGNANSGHYWAYLHLHDKWFKFNDMIVTQIEEEEVMSVSMGRSESNACAYCLIYVESINFHLENVSDDLDIQFWKSRISSYLTQEIIDDNDRLQREIIEYEEEQKRKKKEELRNFQYNFMQRVREVENLSNSRHTSTYYFSLSIQSDERIRSYAVFLSALGERGAALITIAEEVHQKMFHRKLFDLAQSEDDQDTQRLLEMLNAIGLNILDLPDNEYMAQMELQFNTFILVARLFAAGLYYLRQAEFDDALMSFRLAIYYDSSLDQRVSRQKDIRTYLTINLQRLFQRALDVLLTQYDAAIYQIRRVVALLPSVWETSPQINEYVDKKIIENFALHVNYRSKMYHQVCTKSQIEEIIDIHQEMSDTPDYQLRHNRAKLSQTDRQLLLEEIRKRKQQTIEIEDMESVPLKYYLLDIPTHLQQLAHWLKQMIHNVEMEYHQDANKLEFYDQFRTANYYEDADTTPSYRRMYGDSVSYGSKLDDSDYDDYDNVPNQNNVSNDWNNSPVDYEQNPYPSDEDDPSDYRHTFSDNEDISPVGQVSPTQFKRHQQVGTFKDPTENDDVE